MLPNPNVGGNNHREIKGDPDRQQQVRWGTGHCAVAHQQHNACKGLMAPGNTRSSIQAHRQSHCLAGLVGWPVCVVRYGELLLLLAGFIPNWQIWGTSDYKYGSHKIGWDGPSPHSSPCPRYFRPGSHPVSGFFPFRIQKYENRLVKCGEQDEIYPASF